jgi:hypothetical protein
MKTAKEKAEELVDKYWKINTENDYWTVSLSLGKRMAIIAVNEVLEMVDEESLYFDYWLEVKEEIQKYLL